MSSTRTCKKYVAIPCGAAGLLVLVLTLIKSAGLQYGGAPSQLFVLFSFLFLALLCMALLTLLGCDRQLCFFCLLPISTALLLRMLLMDHCTYDYFDFLSKWAAFFRDNGGVAAIKYPVGNYNVTYLYFLAAISYLNVSDLYLIKLFSLVFDVVLAWGGFRLAAHFCSKESRKPAAVFCLLLLLPTVILNGAAWAQCDVIYGALALHAFAAALEGKPKRSVILIAVAFSFKLQTIFLLPLWGVLWLTRRVKFSHLWLFPVTYLATCLPGLLLGKPIQDILSVYFGQVEEYSASLTLNAPSLYALIPYGMEVNGPLLSKLGIVAAALLVLALLAVLWRFRDRVDSSTLFTAAMLLAVGLPLLLPSMHERYFFLADVLSLTWACLNLRRIPQALLVQIASLGGYHAYLILRYAFPMGWGALMLLAVFLSSAAILYVQLRKPRARSRSV